jgi:hypothetical protein
VSPEWAAVLVSFLGIVLSGAVAYGVSTGITKARINGMKDRMDKMEASRYITREEYEARQTELKDYYKNGTDQILLLIKTLNASGD